MLKSLETSNALLALTRLGIGKTVQSIPHKFDWPAIQDLAVKHGLLAVVLDGIDCLKQLNRENDMYELPDRFMLLQWIGEVHQGLESFYESYKQAIGEMAAFYNAHGFKMMILKGYACSLDWPKPEHRPCGDIDIWLFGQFKEADAILAKEKGIKVNNSHHHHTVFNWRDFLVENHYDFINVYHHKSHSEFEKILKELGKDDSNRVEISAWSKEDNVGSEIVYLPSPNLHALFLLKHLTLHFSTGEISIRQMLDWAFFVEKHGKEVDWNWFEDVLEKFGMTTIYNIFNAICVEELGFDVKVFHQVQFEPGLKARVLNDILFPEFGEEEPVGLKRIAFKFRRWKANGWKHKLCYKESMWSAFWYGIWNHLLKPSSI